jgi:hypothetical protein
MKLKLTLKKMYLLFVLFISLISLNLEAQNNINPYKYIATLTFDGTDNFDSGETNFPVSSIFNTTQDANNDSVISVEDNLENIVLFSIGDSIYGTGRTGLTNRGYNDQQPAVYFHFVETPDYNVYEYWLYYADNNWANNHEHDWEKYFIYVQDTTPIYIMLSNHIFFNTFSWYEISTDNSHPVIGVEGGSHAMKTSIEDGVQIRYNGEITQNNGSLNSADSLIIPWIIYSNDSNIINITPFIQSPDTFYGGDPEYSAGEYQEPYLAPWLRDEWDNPPSVATSINDNMIKNTVKIYPNPTNDLITIENTAFAEDEIISIYNIHGQLLLQQETKQAKTEIDISNLAKGVYVVKLGNTDGVSVQKFIKQ